MRKDTPGWSVFQRADGSWVLKYEAAPQQWKQHRLAATTERKAKQEARTWLATNRAAGTLPGVTRTVRELSAQWIKLRAASPKLATSTIRDNESQMKNHIVSRLGDIGVGDLTPAMLREFVRGHRDAVSPNTLRNIMATLSAFYDDCRAEGWVDAAENIVRHPAVLREMPTIRNQREEVVWLPLADVQLLIGDEIVQLDRRVLYAVAFTSGLRSGELFGLKWCEVELDVEVPSMSVTQALALKGDPDKWIGMAKPKTHKSQRVVPLHRAALGALRWWLDEGWELWTGRRPGPADHVFPSPHGKPWRPKGAKRIREDLRAVGRSGQSAKGNPVDFHASRRSFLTWLKEAGVDDLYRKRLAGHSDSSVTNTSYTGAELRLLRDVVNRIALEWRNARPEPPPNDPNRAMVAHQVRPHQKRDRRLYRSFKSRTKTGRYTTSPRSSVDRAAVS
ncbi:MAG: tyrosine-type recombinase/integrase [Solirubrobacterales bacterium]